jgi:hypothetical protein
MGMPVLIRPLAALAPLFSTALLAQSVGPIEFGVGLKTAQGVNMLGDMAGKTPSVGAIAEARLYPIEDAAIRFRASFDNWGNQHLVGTIGDRCEVKRMAGTVGFMIFRPIGGYVTYTSLEFGIARWNIDSTYPSLAKQYFSKPAGALIFGREFKHFYVELGYDYSFFGKQRKLKEDSWETVGAITATLGHKF